MIILEEHFKWHLEAFASELFKWLLRLKRNRMLLGECFYITTAVFSGLNHLLD